MRTTILAYVIAVLGLVMICGRICRNAAERRSTEKCCCTVISALLDSPKTMVGTTHFGADARGP